MRLLYGGWGAGLLDGGTRSRVFWVWRGVYMGVNYACTKLRLAQYTPIYTPLPTQHTPDLVPPSNNPTPHPPYKRRMPNVTAYVFFVNSST